MPRLKDLGPTDAAAALALAVTACVPFLPPSDAVNRAGGIAYLTASFILGRTMLALKVPGCSRDYHAYDPLPARLAAGLVTFVFLTAWAAWAPQARHAAGEAPSASTRNVSAASSPGMTAARAAALPTTDDRGPEGRDEAEAPPQVAAEVLPVAL